MKRTKQQQFQKASTHSVTSNYHGISVPELIAQNKPSPYQRFTVTEHKQQFDQQYEIEFEKLL